MLTHLPTIHSFNLPFSFHCYKGHYGATQVTPGSLKLDQPRFRKPIGDFWKQLIIWRLAVSPVL